MRACVRACVHACVKRIDLPSCFRGRWRLGVHALLCLLRRVALCMLDGSGRAGCEVVRGFARTRLCESGATRSATERLCVQASAMLSPADIEAILSQLEAEARQAEARLAQAAAEAGTQQLMRADRDDGVAAVHTRADGSAVHPSPPLPSCLPSPPSLPSLPPSPPSFPSLPPLRPFPPLPPLPPSLPSTLPRPSSTLHVHACDHTARHGTAQTAELASASIYVASLGAKCASAQQKNAGWLQMPQPRTHANELRPQRSNLPQRMLLASARACPRTLPL
jgi:hypothetical protein